MDFIGSTSVATIVSSSTIGFLSTSGLWPYFAVCAAIPLTLYIIEFFIFRGTQSFQHDAERHEHEEDY
jgi:hypothetical protein